MGWLSAWATYKSVNDICSAQKNLFVWKFNGNQTIHIKFDHSFDCIGRFIFWAIFRERIYNDKNRNSWFILQIHQSLIFTFCHMHLYSLEIDQNRAIIISRLQVYSCGSFDFQLRLFESIQNTKNCSKSRFLFHYISMQFSPFLKAISLHFIIEILFISFANQLLLTFIKPNIVYFPRCEFH